jgi:ubiquinone/menaquinone biosynthesis C-methylase UbiE
VSARQHWQFAGNVPENYERYLVPSIFGPWAGDLVEAAALRRGDRVLDIACGTGIVARTAVRALGTGSNVVGLDVSAPMLAVAKSAAEGEVLSVEWREGSAMKLPFADGAFDVAFCQQGLQFFPDRSAALSEIHRVMAPGGRLVLSVWREIELSPAFVVLADALARHISPEAGKMMTAGPFSWSDQETLRATIAGAGFSDITVRPAQKILRFPSPIEFVLRYAAGSALGSTIAGVDDDARAAFIGNVSTRLQSSIDDQGLAFPIESNIGIARK